MKSAQIPVIYENAEIVVINKKQGLSAQGGAGVRHSVDADLSEQLGRKIFLVHRLDKETEGLLLCAKSSASAAKWSGIFARGGVEKEYKALCVGVPKKPRGRIATDVVFKGERRRAETLYSIERSFEFDTETGGRIALSLARLVLRTGRTHQIRIHLADTGLPICGDDKHGDFAANRLLKKELGIRRLCLCAFRLVLKEGGMVFEIPVGFERLLPDNANGMLQAERREAASPARKPL